MECFGVLLVLIVAAIPFLIWSNKKRDRKIENAVAGRQKLDVEDLYEKYFRSKEIPFFVVQIVGEILERELNADISRPSNEDDFGKNLNFFREYDSLPDEEIITSLEEEFQIEFGREEVWESFRFVDQIINLVWLKVQEKQLNENRG